jgi:hypothetical protein
MKLELIDGGKKEKSNEFDLHTKLAELIMEYACTKEDIIMNEQPPKWQVYGLDLNNKFGTVCWIKPCEEEELFANKISDLMNKLGGKVKALKFEEL